MAKYDPGTFEGKWQKQWIKEGIYEPDLDLAKKPFYNLMMFPYPSAEGLHVGNMYAFTGADIYGRMKRMQGYDIFEPIGLDGFGIHSENYALKIGAHPMDQAKISQKRFYEQLAAIGNGFAWNERLETYDPEYYRWTQWLFIQMFKRGLAYRKKQAVNWCPSCKTVLADEQVIAGKCERCGTEVIKKELEQWFFKITDYAERLLKNLDTLDWTEKVKIAQRNWIGKSEGALIKFPLKKTEGVPDGELEVFTTRPDTLFGATYMVLAPEHPLIREMKSQTVNVTEVEKYVQKSLLKSGVDRIAEGRDKTGVELKGIGVINPANKKEIPVWVADYVLGEVGTGAIMAVPAHDNRDLEFAKKFNLPVETVVNDEGKMMDSGKFDGMDSEKAKWEITKFVGGKRTVQYRVRDWLISRQRYWGAPIPMIHCEACAKAGKGEQKEMPGWYAAPEKDLPVVLPYVKDFRPKGTGESPLATVKEFYEVKCPGCGGTARRETDVSDTFMDSAWYYLRYLDPKDKKEALNKKRIMKWLPAEKEKPTRLYTGGAEHSVLHLLYVRFVAMALCDWGLVAAEEPFKKFRAHGLLIKDGAKMSKSKGNVVNPDEYVKKFGADTLRMYLMFLAPFEEGGDFRDQSVLGIQRFLERVWKLGEMVASGEDERLKGNTGKAVAIAAKKVTEDIERLHYNTAVSALMICLRALEDGHAAREDFEAFVKLLAPFAPHLTEEIWREFLGNPASIHREAWPAYDASLIVEKKIMLILQVDGKVRDAVSADASLTEAEAKEVALQNVKVKKAMGGKSPQKVIYVDKKLVNIVL